MASQTGTKKQHGEKYKREKKEEKNWERKEVTIKIRIKATLASLAWEAPRPECDHRVYAWAIFHFCLLVSGLEQSTMGNPGTRCLCMVCYVMSVQWWGAGAGERVIIHGDGGSEGRWLL